MRVRGFAALRSAAVLLAFLLGLCGCHENRPKADTDSSAVASEQGVGTHKTTKVGSLGSQTRSTPVSHAMVHASTTASIATAKSAPALTGRVTMEDGSPAAGTTVTARTVSMIMIAPNFDNLPAVGSAVTNEQGKYRIESATGALMVEAQKAGFGIEAADLEPRMTAEGFGAGKTVADFVLRPAMPVEGVVVDPAGNPVPGAVIKSRPTRPRSGRQDISQNSITTAGADGHFRIADFAAAELGVVASAEGMGFVSQKMKAPDSAARLMLPAKGAHAQGTVVRKETGEPVDGALVRYVSMSSHNVPAEFLQPGVETRTDATGQYHIDNLPKGDYTVIAIAPGLRTLPTKTREGLKLKVLGTETDLKQDLTMYAGHTISGAIKDRKSGKPLAAVTVRPMLLDAGTTGTLTSDDQGHYELQHVFAMDGSNCYFTVVREGYSVVENNNNGIGGQGVTIQLDPSKLELTRDLEMLPNVTISGTVQTEDGMPATNCTVANSNRGGWVVEPVEPQPVDSTGHFEISARPSATAVLEANSPGYPTVRTNVQVGDDPVTGTRIVMKLGGTIKGIVVSASGAPIAKASVQVLESKNNSTPSLAKADTDENGVFTAEKVTPGQLLVSASAGGFLPSAVTKLKLASGETTSGLRLVLEKAHFIAGTVTDDNGNPVERVTVSYQPAADKNRQQMMQIYPGMYQEPGNTTQTDALGHYRLEGLPNKPAQSLSAYSETLKNETKSDVAVDQENVDFILKKKQSGAFTGIVLESNTEKPITGFTVEGAEYEVQPDKPNTFILTKISDGDSAQLSITAPGHVKVQASVTASSAQAATPAQQTFHLAVASRITGRVVDKNTKAPIANVTIGLQGLGQSSYYRQQTEQVPHTTSGNDGRFELDGAEPGNNTISFDPSAPYAKLYIDVPVEAGTPADMGEVVLDAGGSIIGKVVKMPGDTPVGGVRLSLNSARSQMNTSAVSGGDGAFEFTGLSNDAYVISASDQTSVRVMIDASDRKEVTIRLGAATLKGTVMKAGQPVAARVSLNQGTYGATVSRNVQCDENGVFTVANLGPGKWSVSVYENDGQGGNVSDTVEIPPGGTVEKTFTLPSGKIVGIVVDEQGQPVAGADVAGKRVVSDSGAWNDVLPGNYNSAGARSNADGTFELPNVRPEMYNITATKKGVGKSDPVQVQPPLEGSSDKVTLTLKPIQTGTLVSVALNMTTGGPIKEAWCILWSGNDKISNGNQRGDDGVMTITDIPAGSYKAQVSSFGFAVSDHEVTIEPGKTTKIEDVLYEAGAVRMAVQDKDGAPVPNADCTLTPDDPKSIEQVRHGKTDTSGLWVIRGLYPGTYSGTAMASGKTPGKGSTSVVAHQPIDLLIKLE